MELQYAFMSFSCPELSFREILGLARDLGYAGVEPRAASDHKHGVEAQASADERARIKEMAADSGIAICCLATSCR